MHGWINPIDGPEERGGSSSPAAEPTDATRSGRGRHRRRGGLSRPLTLALLVAALLFTFGAGAALLQVDVVTGGKSAATGGKAAGAADSTGEGVLAEPPSVAFSTSAAPATPSARWVGMARSAEGTPYWTQMFGSV